MRFIVGLKFIVGLVCGLMLGGTAYAFELGACSTTSYSAWSACQQHLEYQNIQRQ